MSLAARVKWFLDVNRIPYDVIIHSYTESSLETVEAADIPPDKLAKAVLLEDDRGYCLSILPASKRIDLGKVKRELRREMQLATSRDAEVLFFDCEDGAIPPVGSAYGIPTILDDALVGVSDVYFEGGDHVDLVHMDGADFFSLIPDANHADLSC